jgi:hypothetical protein
MNRISSGNSGLDSNKHFIKDEAVKTDKNIQEINRFDLEEEDKVNF